MSRKEALKSSGSGPGCGGVLRLPGDKGKVLQVVRYQKDRHLASGV